MNCIVTALIRKEIFVIMPVNLELKVKLKSFNPVKKLLQEINAVYVKTLNQKDIYYKNHNELLKLRIENDEQSIIKYFRDEKGNDRFSNYEVLHFTDGNAEKFFNKVFEVETIVQKKRQLYMYDNTRVHLDYVKSLGNFLELETLVLNGKADAKKRYNDIINLLQLVKYESIRKSYRNLMIEG